MIRKICIISLLIALSLFSPLSSVSSSLWFSVALRHLHPEFSCSPVRCCSVHWLSMVSGFCLSFVPMDLRLLAVQRLSVGRHEDPPREVLRPLLGRVQRGSMDKPRVHRSVYFRLARKQSDVGRPESGSHGGEESPNLAVAPVQPPSLHLDLRPRRPARPPSIWKKCYLDSSQPESGRYGLVVTLFWN